MLTLIYGAACYVVFLAAFLYAIGFTGNLLVPKSIDSGTPGAWAPSLVIDAVLLGLFAVQHSVMARPEFKKWWTRFVPASMERSTYVLLSSLLLMLMYWQWRPLTQVIWSVGPGAAHTVLIALFWAGWLTALLSTFMVNHFDLFGLRQVYLNWRNQPYAHLPFTVQWAYRFVRHPIMVGFIVAFWAAPVMTLGHLVFALATTGYILIALQLEERDLVRFHGDAYREYQKRVSMLVPMPPRT